MCSRSVRSPEDDGHPLRTAVQVRVQTRAGASRPGASGAAELGSPGALPRAVWLGPTSQRVEWGSGPWPRRAGAQDIP